MSFLGDGALRNIAGRAHKYLTGSEKFYQPISKRVSDKTLERMSLIWGERPNSYLQENG